MHKAVINEDVEAVVFLMSVRADINSKVQNPSLNTPLHLAIKKGTEIVVRHLVCLSVCMSGTIITICYLIFVRLTALFDSLNPFGLSKCPFTLKEFFNYVYVLHT